MGLLSTDITKVKRLSLKKLRLPAPTVTELQTETAEIDNPITEPIKEPETPLTFVTRDTVPANKPEAKQATTWDKEIEELEQFFASIVLPDHPIKFKTGETIKRVNIFLDSHLKTVKANNGKRTFLPFLTRLKELRQCLTIAEPSQ